MTLYVRVSSLCFLFFPTPGSANPPPAQLSAQTSNTAPFYALSAEDISGKMIPFTEFKGRVLLIVNTASQCGYTSQYKGLESLYRKYKGKGFIVLGFPSNDFGGQEPGSNAEVKKFCELKYKVTFPMFAKVNITSQPVAPVFDYLIKHNPNKDTRKVPGWNFWKYVIDKKGNVVATFDSGTDPESPDVDKLISRLISKN